MRIGLLFGSAAVVLAAGVTLAGQAPQAPDKKDQKDAAATVTVAGCVQKETDVLKRTPQTGNIGVSDEFVITHATLNPGASSADKPMADAPPPSAAVSTPGGTDFGKVYRVTGDKEKDLKAYVGQRVEITGTFKHDTDVKSELGSIGTSGRPRELTPANTPEITIASIRVLEGSCSGSASAR
jgi:hypothetical protein